MAHADSRHFTTFLIAPDEIPATAMDGPRLISEDGMSWWDEQHKGVRILH